MTCPNKACHIRFISLLTINNMKKTIAMAGFRLTVLDFFEENGLIGY